MLGLDPGSARIGVAISDRDQRVSSALGMVPRSGDAVADRRALAAMVAEEEVVGVVVGLPLSLNGSVGPAARAVLDEIEVWTPAIGVPIETMDERFTTVAAGQALRVVGRRGKGARERIDSVAAALVLQSWIDRRQSARRAAQ